MSAPYQYIPKPKDFLTEEPNRVEVDGCGEENQKCCFTKEEMARIDALYPGDN
jgi:hypothetical protein